MTTRLISVTTEPVTVAETKVACRLPREIVSAEEDADILTKIKGARALAEQMTARSIAACVWEVTLDAFPDEIQLPFPPILTVESVKYLDADGVLQTLDPSAYSVDIVSEPGWVLPAVGTTWPTTQAAANAVRVRYTAGYGAACPEEVKQWLFMQVGHFYNNREASMIATNVVTTPYVDALLDRAKLYY